MSEQIYSNKDLKIFKNSVNNIFKIEFKKSNPVLLLSLKKFIKGSTCSDDYLLLTFKACSVEMLENDRNKTEKPSVHMVANMVSTLAGQLSFLISEYYMTFLGFNTEKILVIDGSIFLCLDTELMYEIDEQNITIYTPFTSNDFFFSPQIKSATKLPLTVHYKTAYFSLGCLLLYVLLSYNNAFYQEYLISDSLNMQKIMNKYLTNHPIKDTKLYWLVERCLVEEPENRAILFI